MFHTLERQWQVVFQACPQFRSMQHRSVGWLVMLGGMNSNGSMRLDVWDLGGRASRKREWRQRWVIRNLLVMLGLSISRQNAFRMVLVSSACSCKNGADSCKSSATNCKGSVDSCKICKRSAESCRMKTAPWDGRENAFPIGCCGMRTCEIGLPMWGGSLLFTWLQKTKFHLGSECLAPWTRTILVLSAIGPCFFCWQRQCGKVFNLEIEMLHRTSQFWDLGTWDANCIRQAFAKPKKGATGYCQQTHCEKNAVSVGVVCFQVEFRSMTRWHNVFKVWPSLFVAWILIANQKPCAIAIASGYG